MGIKELKAKIKAHKESIQRWRDDEKSDKTPWNIGYNDGFEDAVNSIIKALNK